MCGTYADASLSSIDPAAAPGFLFAEAVPLRTAVASERGFAHPAAPPVQRMYLCRAGRRQIGPRDAPAIEAEVRDDLLRARRTTAGKCVRGIAHDVGASSGDKPACSVHVARACDAEPEL